LRCFTSLNLRDKSLNLRDTNVTSCIIFNPSAARGRARRKLEDLRRVLGPDVDFRPTQHPGHAEELALEAARTGFATVAAAGGDGTVHEVANGLLRADRQDITFAVIPLGSANDYVFSLGQDKGPGEPTATNTPQ